MKDRTNSKQLKRVLSPVSVSDNTAQVGQVIDRQGYQSLTYMVATGAIVDADATFAVLLEESDQPNMAGATTVGEIDLISQKPGVAALAAAGFQFDSDDQVRKLGYVGNKRYTRLTVTPANNSAAALICAMAELGVPDRTPVEQALA